jgi:hypothetical protein
MLNVVGQVYEPLVCSVAECGGQPGSQDTGGELSVNDRWTGLLNLLIEGVEGVAGGWTKWASVGGVGGDE